MASDLFTLVYKEQLAELEQRESALRQQLEQRESALRQQVVDRDQQLEARNLREELLRRTVQDMVERVLRQRFPSAPIRLIGMLDQIHDPMLLHKLHDTILESDDLAAIEQAISLAAHTPAA